MADDIQLSASIGIGDKIKTDDDGTAHWQYVKMAFGPNDTQTIVAADAGFPVVPDSGGFAVQSTLQAGTAEIGKLAAGIAEIGQVKNSGTFAVQSTLDAVATGGMSLQQLGMLAEDNDVVIKASAGTLYFISIQSIASTPVYLKLFNLASFTPGTSSATTQFMSPFHANGAGIVLDWSRGIEFDTGICALISTGIGLTSNAAVSANEVVVQIGYE